MRTSMMEPVELEFPEGRVSYGNLICPLQHDPAQRYGTKLTAVAALLTSIENHNRRWDRFRLTVDALGKPQLSIDMDSSPVVSFSWEGDRLWAALSLDCRRLGIDAALPQDFADSYPFARAFGELEWSQLSRLCDFDASWMAAMLWSAKEAAAKMIGCGFHFVDPRDVTVTAFRKDRFEWLSDVAIPIRTKLKKIRVYSMKKRWGWISFAPGRACLNGPLFS